MAFRFHYHLRWSVELLALLAILAIADRAAAHGGGILIQTLDDQLVTGLDDDIQNITDMDARSFGGIFPSYNAWNDPGFHSLSSPPTGYGALPALTPIYWDFLPMNVEGVTSNLLYWDGSGDVPDFGLPTQPGITMTLFGRNNQSAVADASPDMIPGKVLEQTLAEDSGSLRLHAHQFFSLAAEEGATPVGGFYLLSMHVRMDDYRTSEPFYVTWSTVEQSPAVLNNVVIPWVQNQADELILPGDFDFDGDVDGGDFLTWQRDPRVGSLEAWQTNYGGLAPNVANTKAVPEPATEILLCLAVVAFAGLRCGSKLLRPPL